MSFNKYYKNLFNANAKTQAQQQSLIEESEIKKHRQKKSKISAKSKIEEFFFNLNLSIDSMKEAYKLLEEEIDDAKQNSKSELVLTEVLDYMTDFQIELEKIKEDGKSITELIGIKEKVVKGNKPAKACDFLYLRENAIEKVRPIGIAKKIFKCWYQDKNIRWHSAIVDDPVKFPFLAKNNIRASVRYVVNVLHYSNNVFGVNIPDVKLKILELPQSLYDEMRGQSHILLNASNAFGATKGVIFELSRTGHGLNTKYSVKSAVEHTLNDKEKKIIIEKRMYDLHKEFPSVIDENDLKKQLGFI